MEKVHLASSRLHSVTLVLGIYADLNDFVELGADICAEFD